MADIQDGILLDLSEWQLKIDFAKLSKVPNLKGVIIRVQAGSTHADVKYNEYVAGCKQYGIPFSTYAYFKAVSVQDAIVEATDAYNRMDKDSIVFAVDIESVTTKNPADLVPAGQAFVDYMKSKGLPKVGLYSGEHFYNNNGLANIKSDFEWIARYGANDGNPHVEPVLADELWQFTSVGHVDGISTNVDMNLVTGGTLEYFTGKPILMKPIEVPPPAPAASAPIVDNPIGKVRVVASGLRIRSGAGTNFPVVGTAVQGKIYDLFEVAPPQWHRIGVNQWVWGEGGKYLELNPQTAPAPKPAPTGVYHKVVSGDTVSELAVKYGSTVAQIKAWNGLADVGKISIGQNLKVSEGGAPAPKPAAPQPVYHTVVAGDAVSKLAAHYGSTQAQIKAWNGLKDVDVIRIGQKLRVK